MYVEVATHYLCSQTTNENVRLINSPNALLISVSTFFVGGLLLVIVVGAGVGMILLIRSKKCQKRRKEFISEIRKHTNKKIQKKTSLKFCQNGRNSFSHSKFFLSAIFMKVKKWELYHNSWNNFLSKWQCRYLGVCYS